MQPWGPSIKYVTLFWPILTPSPCHTLSHIPKTPESTSHISDPPIFTRPIVQKSRTKVPGTNSISIVRGCFGPVWFLSSPPSVTIHSQYIWLGPRQQLDKLDSESLSAEFPTFLFSTFVRNLGSSWTKNCLSVST